MTFQMLIPLALLFLAARSQRSTSQPSASPLTTPQDKAKLVTEMAKKELARKLRKKVAMRAAAAVPAKPKPGAPVVQDSEATRAQAAVNAAVAAAVKNAAVTGAPIDKEQIREAAKLSIKEAEVAADAPAASTLSAGPIRSPKEAATSLRDFLARTGRFGTLKDRPEEVRAAQRDLGVKVDGIVGPVTRAAAKKAGVTLPPLKRK